MPILTGDTTSNGTLTVNGTLAVNSSLDVSDGLTVLGDTSLQSLSVEHLSCTDMSISSNLNANNIYGDALYQANSLLMPPGVILPYAVSVAPNGYLLCNGANVSRTTYSALFSVISTTYGVGNGTSTFTLPDLRGRFIVGVNSTNFGQGSVGGDMSATLITSNIPSHSHSISITDPGHSHNITDPGHSHAYQDTIYKENTDGGPNNLQGSSATDNDNSEINQSRTTSSASTGISVNSNTTGITASSSSIGSGSAFSILNPYMGLTYIIKF